MVPVPQKLLLLLRLLEWSSAVLGHVVIIIIPIASSAVNQCNFPVHGQLGFLGARRCSSIFINAEEVKEEDAENDHPEIMILIVHLIMCVYVNAALMCIFLLLLLLLILFLPVQELILIRFWGGNCRFHTRDAERPFITQICVSAFSQRSSTHDVSRRPN